MSPLELRYRRVLRLLPADYRARWAEDMVETFLRTREPDDPEDAEFEAEHGRPGPAEVASVVGLAVRLRLGGAGAPPRAFTRGEIVRRIALVGLLVHAVTAVAEVVSVLVSQTRFPGFAVSDLEAVWVLAGLVWVGAYVALVVGRRSVGIRLAVLGLVPSAVTTWLMLAEGGSSSVPLYRLLMTVLPVLALAAFHHDAPPVRARPWLVALPVGAVVTTVLVLVTQAPGLVVLDWPGMLCAAVVVAAVVHLAAGRAGPWSGALALLAVAVLGERVVTVLAYLGNLGPGLEPTTVAMDVLVAAGVVEGVAVLVVTLPLAARHWSSRPA